MTSEFRLAALAIVVTLFQSCRPADADDVYAVPNERLKRAIKETIKPKAAVQKPLAAGAQMLCLPGPNPSMASPHESSMSLGRTPSSCVSKTSVIGP